MDKTEKKESRTIEQAFAELDILVHKLEEKETSLEEVLGLFLRLKIRPLRIERLEPTLESVFLEVVEQ